MDSPTDAGRAGSEARWHSSVVVAVAVTLLFATHTAFLASLAQTWLVSRHLGRVLL